MQYDIYERTYQQYYRWYDFRSAVYWDADAGYLQLYDSGCKVGNAWNCTAACLDTTTGPGMIWNSTPVGMYTLQNCVVLPAIAALLAGGNLTSNAVKLAQKYQISADAILANNSTADWPVMNHCLNQFCERNSESVCWL